MLLEQQLSIGVLHLEVAHGRAEENRALLTACAEEAARKGARIIVGPELSVSGYSFESRDDVKTQVEVLEGETFQMLAPVARGHGVTICTGIAERDPVADIFYNSAVVIGPDGRLAAHHRKIAAERRWACPGSPSRANVFETPWGRLGVLICADTYYGLLPRSLALQEVDLLLVPANWPPSGLDPRQVWRARALENGMGVVACNRTGKDRSMDCRESRSCVISSEGEFLLDEKSERSHVWTVPYPLVDGRLAAHRRKRILEERNPRDFSNLYLHVNGLEDFSGLWGLPPGGPLEILCLVSRDSRNVDSMLEAASRRDDQGPPALVILSRDIEPHRLQQIINQGSERPLAVVAGVRKRAGVSSHSIILCGERTLELEPSVPWVTADFGPSRLALARPDTLQNPEAAVALSKIGCDVLVVVGVNSLDPDTRLLLGVKSLERMAVVAAAPDGALICEPPVGHAPWKETSLIGEGTCRASMDTCSLRRKFFQDRVDMELLLRRSDGQTASRVPGGK